MNYVMKMVQCIKKKDSYLPCVAMATTNKYNKNMMLGLDSEILNEGSCSRTKRGEWYGNETNSPFPARTVNFFENDADDGGLAEEVTKAKECALKLEC
jgi:hypothetical protein